MYLTITSLSPTQSCLCFKSSPLSWKETQPYDAFFLIFGNTAIYSIYADARKVSFRTCISNCTQQDWLNGRSLALELKNPFWWLLFVRLLVIVI